MRMRISKRREIRENGNIVRTGQLEVQKCRGEQWGTHPCHASRSVAPQHMPHTQPWFAL